MSYEPIPLEVKRMLANLTLAWREALLVGGRAPIVEQAWERSEHPQPGDWVVETSTLYTLTRYPDRRPVDLWDGQFTRYLRSERRWFTGREDAEKEHDGSYTLDEPPEREDWWVTSDTYWICENPDGTEYAWSNASLMTVPLDGALVPR